MQKGEKQDEDQKFFLRKCRKHSQLLELQHKFPNKSDVPLDVLETFLDNVTADALALNLQNGPRKLLFREQADKWLSAHLSKAKSKGASFSVLCSDLVRAVLGLQNVPEPLRTVLTTGEDSSLQVREVSDYSLVSSSTLGYESASHRSGSIDADWCQDAQQHYESSVVGSCVTDTRLVYHRKGRCSLA